MKIPTLLVVVLLAVLPAYGQVDPRKAQVGAVERLLGQLHAADQFEGVALVADEEGLLFQRAYGVADRNWETPATLDTRYLIASITKQFTAGVILKLVEEEKLALDAPLGRYLPSWKRHAIGKATLHQLLNHSSGLPLGYQNVDGFDRIELYRRHGTARVLELHASIEPIFKPGQGHEYSNFAYTLLAAVIERVEQAPYPEVLRKRIFEPLGMRSTLEPELASIVPKMARGYAPVLDDFVEAAPTDLTIVRGAACQASTVGDLFRWERALYRDDFLTPASREAIFTPSSENYGYGWFTQPLELGNGRSVEVVRHDGIWPGHMTVVARVPERRIAVILMANRTDVDVNGIADLLLRLLHGEAVEPPPTPAAQEIYRTLIRDGVEAAAKRYRTLEAQPGRVVPNQRRLNGQGYLLLRLKRAGDAVAVFELNATLFPDSWNAFDSLGEGYLEADRLDSARKAYERSLELEPRNANAKEKLERIPKLRRAR